MNRVTYAVAFALTICAPIANRVGAADQPALKNPSFEQGLDGWAAELVPGMAQYLSVDLPGGGGAPEGARALRLRADDPGVNPWLSQGVGSIRGGAIYRLSAMVRGAPGRPARAGVKIEFYTDQNQNTSGYYGTSTTAPDGSWQRVEVTAEADADSAKAAVLVRLFGAGEVWVDDVRLVETAGPPPLTFRPAALVVEPGVATKARFEVGLAKSWGEVTHPPFQLRLWRPGQAGDGEALSPTIQRLGMTQFALETPLPALPAGMNQLGVSLGGVGTAQLRIYAIPTDPRPASLSPSGRWIIDGSPTIPIGLCHAAPEDYPSIAAAGFTAVQGLPTLDEATVRGQLQAAQMAGLRVLAPLYAERDQPANRQLATELARSLGGHPGLLGFELADQPDLRPPAAREVAESYLALRQAQASLPAALSLARAESVAWWGGLCDMVEVGPLAGPGATPRAVGEQVAAARAALRPWQGVIAVLPAGWGPGTQPDEATARLMVYSALMNGASAIFWYALRDVDWNLMQTPLWGAFPRLNAEAARLGELAVGERYDGLEVSAKQLLTSAFLQGDRLVIMLINPTQSPVETRLRTREEPTEVTVLSTGAALEVSRRVFRLTLAPMGAEAITLRLGAEPVPGE